MKLKVSKTLLAWQYCILTCSADWRGDTPATALAANLGKNKLQYVICCTLWCTTTCNHSNLLLAALSAINIANFGYPSDSNGSFDSLSCSRYNFFSTASNIQTRKHYCERLLCSLFLPGGEDANSLRIILTLKLNSTSQTVTSSYVCAFFSFLNGRASLSPKETNWSRTAKKNKLWCTNACLRVSHSTTNSVRRKLCLTQFYSWLSSSSLRRYGWTLRKQSLPFRACQTY